MREQGYPRRFKPRQIDAASQGCAHALYDTERNKLRKCMAVDGRDTLPRQHKTLGQSCESPRGQ